MLGNRSLFHHLIARYTHGGALDVIRNVSQSYPCGKALLDFVYLSSTERDGHESIVKRLVDEPETARRRAADIRRNAASSLYRLAAVYQSLLCGLEKDPILDG